MEQHHQHQLPLVLSGEMGLYILMMDINVEVDCIFVYNNTLQDVLIVPEMNEHSDSENKKSDICSDIENRENCDFEYTPPPLKPIHQVDPQSSPIISSEEAYKYSLPPLIAAFQEAEEDQLEGYCRDPMLPQMTSSDEEIDVSEENQEEKKVEEWIYHTYDDYSDDDNCLSRRWMLDLPPNSWMETDDEE